MTGSDDIRTNDTNERARKELAFLLV